MKLEVEETSAEEIFISQNVVRLKVKLSPDIVKINLKVEHITQFSRCY